MCNLADDASDLHGNQIMPGCLAAAQAEMGVFRFVFQDTGDQMFDLRIADGMKVVKKERDILSQFFDAANKSVCKKSCKVIL
ncbi:hypothetical protein SDC9_103804 [bioreactor metagenome]|uniref:Uncharacterized protein n=1 Tax=bioreactor metagenome TaxID=1076179 RepID=A0A645AV41_9ZZZZ